MKVYLKISCLFLLLANIAFAQQMMTLSGLVKSESELLPNTRVGLHVIDQQNNRYIEVLGVNPIAGTFNLSTTAPLDSSLLRPLLNGGTVLPGLDNEFTVSPEGALFARAITNTYIDSNNNATFDDSNTDPLYLGFATVENPPGWVALIYVDRDVTLSSASATLQLNAGWNIYTARSNQFAVQKIVNDALLDMILAPTLQ